MLAILTTHPIQYQTPIWQALAADGRVPFEVWYLTRHGIEPSLDPEFGTTFRWDIETLSGYPYRFVNTAKGATPGTPWQCRLRERLRDRIFDSGVKVLWIQGWQVAAYWQAVREAKAAGIEVWLRAESNDLAPVAYWKGALKRVAHGWLFDRVDRFLCIGMANKRLYQKFGVPEARLYRAPYAVDNERFARQAATLRSNRIQLRRSWGIADDAFCVLFCGKFIAKKRPLDLAGAAQLLRSSGRLRNVHLLFAGAGEIQQTVRDACAVVFDAHAASPHIPFVSVATNTKPPASFVGFLNQTEISQAYVAADCLVLPSDYGETWGLVVNEALASGVPCLVSDACGCVADLAGDGLSFPVSDIAALADRLAALQSGLLNAATPPLHSFTETVSSVARAYRDATSAL